MKTIDDLTFEDLDLIEQNLEVIPDVERSLNIMGYDGYSICYFGHCKAADVPRKHKAIVKRLREIIAKEGTARYLWSVKYAKAHKIAPDAIVAAFSPWLVRVAPTVEQKVLKIEFEGLDESN